MKYKVAFLITVFVAFAFNAGDSFWGRRRRRGWFRKTVGTVGTYLNNNKHWLVPAVTPLLGDDLSVLKDLSRLKSIDHSSYEEFMEKVKAILEKDAYGEDLDNLINALDEISDMHPDELNHLVEDRDLWDYSLTDIANDKLKKDLESRIANIDA